MPSVLIVDDLLSIHEMLDAVIQPTGFTTSFATNGENAIARYKAEKFDLVLADIDMKPMDGISLLKQLKAYDPGCVLIIMTAYASTESAIQALKHGAFDYLQKPFRVDELISTLKRGIEFRKLQAEKAAEVGTHALKGVELDVELVGVGAAMKKLTQQVKKLASARTPVLLQGEAGTGKALLAELIHTQSNVGEAPYVVVDCQATNEAELKEGLFGAGSGGSIVQQAKGGSLHLAQIHALPVPMQKEIVSVIRANTSNFRLLCSTTEDLERLTDEGRFHDELFYRVASLPVQIPPLRERVEDIPVLAKHFARDVSNEAFDTALVEFSDEALGVLSRYRWPGNLTELAQVVRSVVSVSDTRVVQVSQLPAKIREQTGWQPLNVYLAEQQKKYIEQALRACRGDKAKAAALIGVDVSVLG